MPLELQAALSDSLAFDLSLCSRIVWDASAFSASSRLFDLNGETNSARQRQNSAIIVADGRRFAHVINTMEFSEATPPVTLCAVDERRHRSPLAGRNIEAVEAQDGR